MDNSVDMDHEDYATGDNGRNQSASKEYNFVKQLIDNNKVVVFSKSQCPHCSDSKTLLNSMGVRYTSIELDKMSQGPQVQNVLGQITDARTVPRIFIGGQCVGGNSDLQSLDQNGSLQNILKEL